MEKKTYVAIDLKSYYASVECAQRGLDPLTTNLVVADLSRTEKTICLAVSPSLKSYGISGRARLFEVVQRVKEVNRERLSKAPGKKFSGKSYINPELIEDPSLELDYIVAPPRMKTYMQTSAKIYEIYLKYVSQDDIHVYSVDEVFIDATQYLRLYKMNARDFTMMLVREVLNATGITATAGIGENLYLCKIAMDIVAKHIPADKDGVRIAELTEMEYREQLWDHKPITDFWRVGRGTAKRLANLGLYTMGDVARCSIGGPSDFHNEDLLYKTFGVNAELLIDHAWGFESCEIKDIKNYRPDARSLSQGQVLSYAYSAEDARIITWEMADSLVLDLVRKNLLTDQIVLTVCYDKENLSIESIRNKYAGPVDKDFYGMAVPKSAHGSINLGEFTSSTKAITDKTLELYDEIVNKDLLVRRIYVVANHVETSSHVQKDQKNVQYDLFTDFDALQKSEEAKAEFEQKEKQEQKAILAIKERFGKNAILKLGNLQDQATARERNGQVGGHKG